MNVFCSNSGIEVVVDMTFGENKIKNGDNIHIFGYDKGGWLFILIKIHKLFYFLIKFWYHYYNSL